MNGHDARTLVAKVDAVYVGPNPQLSSAEVQKLAAGLIERRLPSFSWLGKAEVELGLLAGLGSPDDAMRLARRVALNFQSIVLGKEPARLVTAFKRNEQLSLNLMTARAIGLWPNWSVISDAVLIGKKRENVSRRLTLASAVRQAMRSNLELAVADQGLRAGAAEVRRARANLLPHVDVSAGAAWIDSDRAGFGAAQRTAQWSATLSQSIYSEPAWANLDIQHSLQRTREEERASLRLDVAFSVAAAYLNLLKAQTIERIQRENLARTRSHLAVSRVRREVGSAGRGEVFRWEAEIANSRRDVIMAVSLRNQAEIEVNRLLSRPLEESFVTREASVDDPVLLSSEQRFRDYLNNPFRFKVLREFFVREGLATSPEVRRVNAALAATRRRLSSTRRSFYVPRVDLSAGATHRFYEGGEGSEPVTLPPGTPDLGLPSPDEWDFFVGVSATLPLYEGGARFSATDQAEHEYAKLNLQKKMMRQLVEQRIRVALHRAGASFPSIKLSRDAARAAQGNLKVVSDGYSRGAASILTLLDAQHQVLVAELAAANAAYEFLSDLMLVERAVGKFDFFVSAEDRQAMFSRLGAFSTARRRATGARPSAPRQRKGGK